MPAELDRRKSKSPQWAVVFSAHSLAEAHIVMGRLQANGIRAILQQEAVASAIGITIGSLGEIRVLVSPADYARAAALLADDDAPPLEASNDSQQLILGDDAPSADDDE